MILYDSFPPLLSLLFQSCLWFCHCAPDPSVQSVWAILCKSHCSLKVGAGRGGLMVLKAFNDSLVPLRFLLTSSILGGKYLGHLKSLLSAPCSGSEVGAAEFLWSLGAASAHPESLASPPRTLAVAVSPTCVLARSSVPARAGWGSAPDNQALLSERGCKWACWSPQHLTQAEGLTFSWLAAAESLRSDCLRYLEPVGCATLDFWFYICIILTWDLNFC